ncbi:MAG: hypothetical protein Q9223_000026 [Gallowayella weberi]
MRPSTFDLSETQHVLTRRNLKLVTRTRLHATLPDHLTMGKSAQDLLMAGLWIVRGNRMNLQVRADFDALSRESNLDHQKFEAILSDTLPEAKLWSQLSLKASLINPYPSGRQGTEEVRVVFALNHFDALQPNPASMRAGGRIGIAAKIQDTRPPKGICNGFMDSIEIALHYSPLVRIDPSSDPQTTPANQYHTHETGSELAQLQAIKIQNNAATGSSPHQTLVREEETDEDMLSISPRIEILSNDIEMLDDGIEGPEMLTLPEMALQPGVDSHAALSTSQNPKMQEPSRHSGGCGPDLLDLVRLLEASLRHTLCGISRLSRRPRRSQKDTPDVQLVRKIEGPSLADISPVLFRPGEFQVRLWHLLQKRKWPTTAIEPLSWDEVEIFDRYEKDRELLHDSDHKCDKLRWTRRGWEKDDEEMLDHDLHFPGGVDDPDEDLFSSYEGTPSSSQGTAGDCFELLTDHEDDMLLEND